MNGEVTLGLQTTVVRPSDDSPDFGFLLSISGDSGKKRTKEIAHPTGRAQGTAGSSLNSAPLTVNSHGTDGGTTTARFGRQADASL